MSRHLETMNESPGGNFNFYGSSSETSEVNLGVLEPMPIEQFCGYATEALIKAIKTTDARTAAQLGYAVGKLEDWVLKPSSTIHTEIQPESLYTANPFTVIGKGDRAVIAFGTVGKGYIVKPQDFMGFVDYVFRGGEFGWNFMPSGVKSNVSLLRKAVLGN